MSEDNRPTPAAGTKTSETFHWLRQELARFLPCTADEITLAQRFEELITATERRQVWQQLADEGITLPALELTASARLLATVAVLGPLSLVAVLLRDGLVLLSVGEAGLLTYRLTRRWAVHPPSGCETVREAVLHLTPFRRQDSEAGLWPHEEIAAKVRLIVARATGMPFASVTEDTRLDSLCG